MNAVRYLRTALSLRVKAGLSACLLCLSFVSTAQETLPDPPSGRIARLSYLQGDVTLAPADSDERDEAVLNQPLTSGDRLQVAPEGRAELQLDSAAIYLDQNASFGFVELGDEVMQMSLTDGAAMIRVRRRAQSETVQVETPNVAIALLHPGEYHVEVDPEANRTILRTRSGEAEVFGGELTHVVRAGEEGVFSGSENLSANIGGLGPRTAFEEWANDRDRSEQESASSRYVSQDVIGYEDLDEHGDWVHEPRYGHVWAPRHVAQDWAPYRHGRWLWVAPLGWTWVDDARWGFAPFHYGRWVYSRSRWCWVPGPRHRRYPHALTGIERERFDRDRFVRDRDRDRDRDRFDDRGPAAFERDLPKRGRNADFLVVRPDRGADRSRPTDRVGSGSTFRQRAAERERSAQSGWVMQQRQRQQQQTIAPQRQRERIESMPAQQPRQQPQQRQQQQQQRQPQSVRSPQRARGAGQSRPRYQQP